MNGLAQSFITLSRPFFQLSPLTANISIHDDTTFVITKAEQTDTRGPALLPPLTAAASATTMDERSRYRFDLYPG